MCRHRFVPQEDQGYIILQIQAPPGASLSYTDKLANQAQAIVMHEPEVDSSFAVTGFSFAGSAANYGLVFVSLKPFSQRKGADHSAGALVSHLRGKLFVDPGRTGDSVRASCDSGHRQFWRISV